MTIGMRREPLDTVETIGKGDVHYVVDNIFGSVVEKNAGPQVFLVHQGPNDVTAPHFHGVPQYQVFTRGGGRFGRADIAPPALHYADAWTAYGPIVAGDDGVDYFTARIHADVGAGWMPEARRHKPQKSGRHFTVDLHELDDLAPGEPRTLIERHADGLFAAVVRLEPRAEYRGLPAFEGSGRLVTLLHGGVAFDGREYGHWSWGHAQPDPEPTVFTATADGAVLLVCDYPAFAWPDSV